MCGLSASNLVGYPKLQANTRQVFRASVGGLSSQDSFCQSSRLTRSAKRERPLGILALAGASPPTKTLCDYQYLPACMTMTWRTCSSVPPCNAQVRQAQVQPGTYVCSTCHSCWPAGWAASRMPSGTRSFILFQVPTCRHDRQMY